MPAQATFTVEKEPFTAVVQTPRDGARGASRAGLLDDDAEGQRRQGALAAQER